MSEFKIDEGVQVWRMEWRNMFDPAEVKDYVNHKKNYRIRLRLLFKPLEMSIDTSEQDGTAISYYKEHNNKIYIYRVDWTPPNKDKDK